MTTSTCSRPPTSSPLTMRKQRSRSDKNVPFQAGFSPSALGSSLGGLTGTSGTGLTSGVGAGLGSLVGGLGSFFAPIQRQNVDLKLKIKPQINEGGQIKMVIDEQTEEIASQDPVLGPTTSKRSAKSTIVVGDQQTVVIGGMIRIGPSSR